MLAGETRANLGIHLAVHWSCLFMLAGETRANLGIHLAVLFCQPGKKIGQSFYPGSKKEQLHQVK